MLQTRIKNRLIRRGIVALALLAVLLGIPIAAAQTFDEAVAADERGDYATAIRGFRVHAEQGLAEAQLALGSMYAKGKGVPKNAAEAGSGTGWPPSRATTTPSSISASCTPRARVCRRTMPRP